ncbi:hypothetical protein [Bartonella henselae]|uniref:hypothetical protein n=1 Tax=Bartonella henselae TaxID=38323 RepID=UPI0002EB6707|nr:hypothetical protein [Bartonella henselae]ETS04156.1 hypothetical protein Q654_01555 [Bartonella henselae JK 50]ETS04984.1 hypothetical protein Q655_01502 [Bartonella henselae JK 51]MDM9988069.1 hypothetical protein [Bartonella henselae]MDM9993959.1 hypothetical protein [Bartonella henselae]
MILVGFGIFVLIEGFVIRFEVVCYQNSLSAPTSLYKERIEDQKDWAIFQLLSFSLRV